MAAATTQTIRAKVNGAAAKMQAQAQALGINLPPVNTDSAPEVSLASSGFTDSMAAMGVALPSWQKMAYGFVALLATSVAVYFAAPVLASILVAGTLTVTANGFALWLASALGYLITAYLTFKVARGVGFAASWLGSLAPKTAAA